MGNKLELNGTVHESWDGSFLKVIIDPIIQETYDGKVVVKRLSSIPIREFELKKFDVKKGDKVKVIIKKLGDKE